jgi:hypothetical protein
MPPESHFSWRSRFTVAALMVLAIGVALYLALAYGQTQTFAFPLDDAWIHQTYARTFAQSGEWAYRPGTPSTGSTAPLWTLLLSVGYWLGLSPTVWTYGVGIVGMVATILLGGWVSHALFANRTIAQWTMVALAAEWHLIWAGVSGMEIPLYTSLALGLIGLYLTGKGRLWVWGVIGGLLTLTRPEGLWLVGLIGAAWLWAQRRDVRMGMLGGVQMGVGWLVMVAPVLYFNWLVSGQPFPNTFYAKQQEYAILLSQPLWQRVWDVLVQPWLGGQTFLLFALPFLAWRRFTLRQWIPLLWAFGLVMVYVLRLPVTYQHGRYLMPVIPIFVIYGVAAAHALLARLPRLFMRPLAISMGTAFGAFLVLGASSYAGDVAVIECEMGGAAVWIGENVPSDSLIAIHDIGKVGYLTPNPLLDFAGLISPETIPILRDEAALFDLAVERNAAYLVTFADWYATIAQEPRFTPRFATACAVTQAAGREPMTIYERQLTIDN